MDRKFEDQIARLAFGELSEAEAAEVRSMAGRDADSAKALDGYETLRSDLRRLRDVPPDQLSKERLQNAILAQGLKPKPVRSAFPWIWMPATALSALVLFVLLKGPSVQPPIAAPRNDQFVALDVPKPSSGSDAIVYGDYLNDMDRAKLAKEVQGFAREPEVTEMAVAPDTSINARPAPVASSYQPRMRKSSVRSRASSARGGRELALRVGSAPDAKVNREPLVLIQNQRDGNTGAMAAVEVQQTQDVIVSS